MKGELKVKLSCSGIERLLTCRGLLLSVPGAPPGAPPRPVKAVKGFLMPDGSAVLKLAEVAGREEAETLRGAVLAVKPGESVQPPEGSHFAHDLMGCRVVTPAGEELGVVADVMETPANWVLAVRRGEKETLLPAVKSMVRKVDLKARLIVADWPGETDADLAD